MSFRSWLVRQLQGVGSGIYTSDMWRIPASKGIEDYLRAFGEVGWLFAVTSKIAQSVADSKWRIYSQNSAGDLKELPPQHDAVRLLSMVNPFWTSFDLFELHQLYMDLAGESFWYLLKDGARRPRGIWLLPPHRMDVVPSDSLDEFVSGYVFRTARGQVIPLATDEIIHFKRPNPLNVHRGLGPVQAAILDTDTEKFVSEYMRNYFFNNATPGGFIKTKAGYSKEEHDRLIEMFEKRHQGVGAAGRIGVLWGEMDYMGIEVSAKEMQLIATKQMTRNNLLGIYNMPLSVMGITEDVNRANAEAGYYVFAKDVITPRLRRIAIVLTEFFLPLFGPNLVMQFDDIIPEDRAQREDGAYRGYLGGILTLNESRIRYGHDEIDGGDFVLLPGLTPVPVPVDDIAAATEAQDDDDDSSADGDVDLDGDDGKGDDSVDLKLKGRAMLLPSLKYSGRMAAVRKRKVVDEDIIEVDQVPEIVAEVEDDRTYEQKLDERGEEFHRGLQMKLEAVEPKWSKAVRDELDAVADEVAARLKVLLSAQRNITDVLADWTSHDGKLEVILKKIGTSGHRRGGKFAAAFINSSFKVRKESSEAWAAANAAAKIKGISATTRDVLRDIIEGGLKKGQSVADVAKAVQSTMPGHNAVRAKVIARTELQEASQVGAQEQYKADGVEKNQWYTAIDERVCPICAPLHGEIVPVGEKFPGGYTHPPQTHPQCRCDLLPVVLEDVDEEGKPRFDIKGGGSGKYIVDGTADGFGFAGSTSKKLARFGERMIGERMGVPDMNMKAAKQTWKSMRKFFRKNGGIPSLGSFTRDAFEDGIAWYDGKSITVMPKWSRKWAEVAAKGALKTPDDGFIFSIPFHEMGHAMYDSPRGLYQAVSPFADRAPKGTALMEGLNTILGAKIASAAANAMGVEVSKAALAGMVGQSKTYRGVVSNFNRVFSGMGVNIGGESELLAALRGLWNDGWKKGKFDDEKSAFRAGFAGMFKRLKPFLNKDVTEETFVKAMDGASRWKKLSKDAIRRLLISE
jgi:HK97 family phage portal protein